MKRLGLGCLIVLAMIFATGCQNERRLTRRGAAPYIIDPLQAESAGYTHRWVASLDSAGGDRIASATVLGDQLIVIERPSNLVSAISLRDGSVVWRRVVGDRLVRLFEPVRIGDTIMISSEHTLYKLRPQTGEQTGVDRLESPVHAGPAVLEDLLVFGGVNGLIFAHDPAVGFPKMRYGMPAAILTTPVVEGNSVFTADANGNFALLSGRNFSPVWQGRTFGRVSARPAMTANTVFVASEDQALYAINRATGRDRWQPYRATGPLRRGPVVLDNSLYQPLPSEELVSLDPLTGQEIWRSETVAQPFLLEDNRLLLYEPEALLVADNRTGTVNTRARARGLGRVIRGPEESLILVSPEGRLQRLDVEP